MREIKFRGKRVDSGEWVYGYFLIDNWLEKPKYAIIPERDNPIDFDLIEVIPSTVGQYTGLHDKNGKEIYEGDIIEYNGMIEKANYEVICDVDGVYCGSRNNTYNANKKVVKPIYLLKQLGNIEVIGNIYDNQDLLNEIEIIEDTN